MYRTNSKNEKAIFPIAVKPITLIDIINGKENTRDKKTYFRKLFKAEIIEHFDSFNNQNK